MTAHVQVAEDRSIRVPAGATVRTGYVPVHRVRLACRDRMAVGDVGTAFQRRLQVAPDQPFPTPWGEWEDDAEDGARQFVIFDGRHEYVAAVMLGCTHILVTWVEQAQPAAAPGLALAA